MANQYNGQAIVDSGVVRFFSVGKLWTYAPNDIPFQDGGWIRTGNTILPNSSTKVIISGPAIDCSNFVQQTFLNAGYNVGYLTSAAFKSIVQGNASLADASQYNIISTKDIQAGDVVVFEGHVGIVKDYDIQSGKGHFEGSQSTSVGLKDKVAFTTNSMSLEGKIDGEYIYAGTQSQPFIGVVRVNYDNPKVNDSIAAQTLLEKKDAYINYALEKAGLQPYYPEITSIPHPPIRQINGGGIDDPSRIDDSGIEYYDQYDNKGLFTGYTWTAPDGSSGADIYSDGLLANSIWVDSNGIAYKTSYVYINGIVSKSNWSSSDGISGSYNYNQDGSSSGNVIYADGTGYSYSNDGSDNVQVKNFDSTGKMIELDWSKADGSYGSTVLNTDGTVTTTATSIDGTTTTTTSEPSGLQNLIDSFSNINNSETAQAINTYGPSIIDALSLIKAIQSGEPLPVVTTGLRLANDLSILNNNPNYVLSGAANVGSGILSIMSLDAALKNGDTIAAVTAGAQTISFAAMAYAQFATSSVATTSTQLTAQLTSAYGTAGAEAISQLNTAIPYLNIVNSIAHGDEVGAGLAVTELAMINAELYTVPYIGWAYAVYSIVDSLFGGHDIPDPWGTGRFVWDGTNIKIQSAGETGGNEAVSGVMQSVLTSMNSLIEQQRLTNPTSSLGIIVNRMPSVAYDMSGYRYTDIDPLTGEERHPSLRFDTSGNPYNATAGSTESYHSIGEAIIISALERSAIAPMWEVQTAKMQTEAGDPKAGLTEESRAGQDGQLASTVTGDTQTFRPVTLDLGGNGQIDIISKATSGISFDVDDSGYLKESAWISSTDAFLTLDRDYNGETNSGREMFSNSTVAIGRRGLAGMGWVDANYDGKITSSDPVWKELRVWQDANSDGTEVDSESLTLNELGITELNYAMGTFTQNGIKKLLSSPDLEADTQGVKVNVVPDGILIDSNTNGLSLLVTRIDNMTAVQANQDGASGYEDVEMIVSGDALLANDSLGRLMSDAGELRVASIVEYQIQRKAA